MVEAKTLKSTIYQNVFQDVLLNKYPVNTVITEKMLVEQYGVSKSPVREALVELCNEGILRSIPRYGYEVVRLTESDVREIREYRIILECGALERNWDKVSGEHVENLLQIWLRDREEGEKQEALEHWNRNTRFHLALFEAYNNQYLHSNLCQALRVMTRVYAQFFWDKWHSTVFTSHADRHGLIIESMKKGDKQSTLRFLQEDIEDIQGSSSFA